MRIDRLNIAYWNLFVIWALAIVIFSSWKKDLHVLTTITDAFLTIVHPEIGKFGRDQGVR